MPLLYLREAQPFLPADPKQKMIDTMESNKTKGATQRVDRKRQQQLAKRSTALVISDCFIIIVEMLQILALIQSMSLKWSYPETWLKYANFIFLFNADAWEFIKVHSGAYTRVQGLETPSSDIPVDYDHILIAWGIFLLLLGSIFLSIFLILRHRQPPYLMVHYARLERVFIFICQILALPLGTVVFRLHHCPSDQMATHSSVTCFEGLHLAYFVPALFVTVFVFAAVPVWMAVKIRRQKLTAGSRHHEDHMKLKEVEYMAGLDVVWMVQGYHLFSSFHLRGLYYRPIVFVVKLVLLIIFAAADEHIHDQSVALSVILSLVAFAVILIRPFRVLSFNVALSLALGCLAGDCVFGALMTSVTPATVESPWLVEPYSYWVLIGINSILALTLISWIIFMISVRCCLQRCFPNDPVWPVMKSYKYEVEGMETYKFMAAVLRGRAVLDSCIRAPSVFAPVHQLARQIEIINAFCREAEKTKDGLHATLLQLLDDMIDVYRRLEPVSLFSETVKENIRQNASRFVEVMPSFCHRLAQRDYDLILVHPVKKRLLMKMYIIGMFINSKKETPVRDQATQKSLHKIWEELPDVVETKEEVEYREDLYPPPPVGPDLETLYMAGTIDRPLELMDLDDSDEEESLATFLGRVPPVLIMKDEQSRQGSRTSLILKDIETTAEMEAPQEPLAETSGLPDTNDLLRMPEVEEALMDAPMSNVSTIAVQEADPQSPTTRLGSPETSGIGQSQSDPQSMSPVPGEPQHELVATSPGPDDPERELLKTSPAIDELQSDPNTGYVNPAFLPNSTETERADREGDLIELEDSPTNDTQSHA